MHSSRCPSLGRIRFKNCLSFFKKGNGEDKGIRSQGLYRETEGIGDASLRKKKIDTTALFRKACYIELFSDIPDLERPFNGRVIVT